MDRRRGGAPFGSGRPDRGPRAGGHAPLVDARHDRRADRRKRQLFGCVGQVRQHYGTDIVAGLHTAYLELLAERPHAGIPLGQAEIIVLFTDGHNRAGCFDVIRQARTIKANGMRVIVVSVGSHADTECMSDIVVSSADLYTIATRR